MKRIAVWRYGAKYKTAKQSQVGGGRISEQVIEDLRALGHAVVIVDDESHTWDPRAYDVVMILTGPFNAMYGSLYDTYRRLAEFEGEVFYAWWDTALPFHFAPERVDLFKSKSKVTMADLARNKKWTLLTQLKEIPSKAPASCARGEFEATHAQCFWELAEVAGDAPHSLAPHPNPVERMAYFGSPRPGRITEIKRWFGQPGSPPCDLYGKWSDKQLAKVLGPNLTYKGPVAEADVRATLNKYAATLHSADSAYIKSDFIAQRFMENAMACVPVAYSDRIQPSVLTALGGVSPMRDVSELSFWFRRLLHEGRHRELAITHSNRVLAWARHHPHAPKKVLESVL